MKFDDFEKQLQRQPLKKMPGEWRDQILSAASASSDLQPSTFNLRPLPWWRALLWPNPAAWAGLAATWAAIFALNMASPEKLNTSAVTTPAPSPEVRHALNQQKQLFAELIRSPEVPPVEPPKPFIPRPRSARQLTILAV
jgi:hypothetical protein